VTCESGFDHRLGVQHRKHNIFCVCSCCGRARTVEIAQWEGCTHTTEEFNGPRAIGSGA